MTRAPFVSFVSQQCCIWQGGMPRRSSDRSISMAHARHPHHSHHPPMCPRPRESPRARARGGTTHGGRLPPTQAATSTPAEWGCASVRFWATPPRASPAREHAQTSLPYHYSQDGNAALHLRRGAARGARGRVVRRYARAPACNERPACARGRESRAARVLSVGVPGGRCVRARPLFLAACSCSAGGRRCGSGGGGPRRTFPPAGLLQRRAKVCTGGQRPSVGRLAPRLCLVTVLSGPCECLAAASGCGARRGTSPEGLGGVCGAKQVTY